MLQEKVWMIRAGKQGRLFEIFKSQSIVALGWNKLAPLDQYHSNNDLRCAYVKAYPDSAPAKIGNSVAMLHKFVNIQKDDYVMTYSPVNRKYLLGRDLGRYIHQSSIKDDYQNTREVNWLGTVNRDALSKSAQRSLSSVLTMFSLNPLVLEELLINLDLRFR